LHANTLKGVYHRIGQSVVTDSCCSCVVAFKNLAALHCIANSSPLHVY